MIEVPVQFGPEQSLVGVLTRPDLEQKPTLAFLTFNAGMLPRIGPHRLNVKLARALAGRGEASLRFDLSGQGDSRSATGGGDFRAQAVTDIRHAMDHLEQTYGIRRFALIGVCSGAVNSYSTALLDARVAGVLMFDGYWCRSRWTRLVRDWKRFRSLSWPMIGRAVLRRMGALVPQAPAGVDRTALRPQDGADLDNVSRAELVRSLQALVDRDVATFFVYSGSVIDYYSYANQFRDAFRREAFVDQVRCDYCPQIDHTFTTLDAQRRMIDVVLSWVGDVRRAAEVIR